ncbi:MAG: Wzz/FepE/Etk N-terminal domain-containing protein [Terriglobales bacterium]|jgi:tyrosine-protein kinase Etk/Wzc
MNRMSTADAGRENSTDVQTMDVQTGNTETMHDDTLELEARGLETAALRPAARAVRGEPYECRVLDLLIILSRRKPLILRATLAAALLAGMVSLLLPNRYTATANILPPQQSQSLAASMIGQLGPLGPMAAMAQKDLGLKNPNDLYVGMLRSRTAEDALIRRFDLRRVYRDKKMSDARHDLENASSIVLGKEGFVSISVEDKDPSRASQIANAYVDELRQLTQDLAVTEAGQRRLFFERQLELAKNNLADAEQALKETEQKTGLIQLDGQAKAIIESVVKLRALMAAKEVELHAMRLFSTEQNPDVMLGEQQLSGLRAQLALMEKQSSGPADIQVSASSVPSGNVPEAGLQYVRKLREVKYAEAMFELLAKQYEAARLDEAKTAAVIQVLDPAIEPDRKSSPERTWMVVIATLLGLFGSVGYVLSSEALGRMRLNPDVNERLTMLKTAVLQPHFQPRT